MHIVEEREFCEKTYPAFTKVFIDDLDRCWHYLFTDSITSRIIVFDTSNGNIDDAIPMQLIINAARDAGDNACYFNIAPNLREPDFYHVPLDDLELYYKWCNNQLDRKIAKENQEKFREWGYRYPLINCPRGGVIFSESGNWGIITNYCCKFGFIGGSDIFISSLKQALPDLDKQVFCCLFDFYLSCHSDGTNYLEEMDSAGIKSDLEHVYGLNRAAEIIAMSPSKILANSGQNLVDLIHPEFLDEFQHLLLI